ncbi:adenylosuccinate lyase [Salinibacter ruber]|uniref:Adenylosuccinate lyase n=1 Tax=Salinibacter ruber TaxID=146919 RepID=A0AAW5P8T8_9BACT|nr:adenylosuccinate lyase [Salinibacter ruber]MCS3663817.1 adenylosuccinate lyase [Salinibacter ruber]MCS3956073.1 adenylosuccinate lyase [Salinibacter ruber]MCS4158196.1 adenylosuccinate lyase [Salinibacter ruber]MCS4161202.1 adenylosuccinate lyase [Salinibacter ruber]MCS4221049.1 adenylosuccinate lyase [Salinibacter ruber]
MIDRYTRPPMGDLWSEEQKFQSWLDVELAACAAWSEIGAIPPEDVETLYDEADFDVDRIHEIEKETKHDVVAFTRAVSETLGEEKKWVHYGLTSTDVVDTAYMVRIKKANSLIRTQLDGMIETLAEKAREHKHTLTMGRTHGVHAEPTTFGLKMARYYDEMKRQKERFERAAEEMRMGKLSGAVGTFAHIPPEVERLTCERLGLKPAPISTQVLSRDRHANYLSVIAGIGATLEKMAVEVRHLQRSEVREAEEAFSAGQKGSSAMPHKRNPVGSENITGCARLLRGYMNSEFDNVALWHERDISHSSVERIVLPDATTLLHYALRRFRGIIDGLVVYEDTMRENMEETYGLYNSQRLMLKLIDTGLNREEAYDRVQPLAMTAWEEERPFQAVVAESDAITEVLSDDEIEEAFDPTYHVRNVDRIFRRVGLEE